jgi:hypothetical protein
VLKVRPFVRKFHSSEYINALANGDICIALGWSGDVFQARNRAVEAKQASRSATPFRRRARRCGSTRWRSLPMRRMSPRRIEFINYMMKPEVIAKASNYVLYANGNKASQQFVDKEVLDDPAIYPTPRRQEALHRSPYDPKAQRVVTRTVDQDRHRSVSNLIMVPATTCRDHFFLGASGPQESFGWDMKSLGSIRRDFAPWTDPGRQAVHPVRERHQAFGDFTAVDDLSLNIYEREFFACSARPAAASPRCCACSPVSRSRPPAASCSTARICRHAALPRPVNMMFQSYALFPHMTVEKNIAFGLRRTACRRTRSRTRVCRC